MELGHQPVQSLSGAARPDFTDNFPRLLLKIDDWVHELFALNQLNLRHPTAGSSQPQASKRGEAGSIQERSADALVRESNATTKKNSRTRASALRSPRWLVGLGRD